MGRRKKGYICEGCGNETDRGRWLPCHACHNIYTEVPMHIWPYVAANLEIDDGPEPHWAKIVKYVKIWRRQHQAQTPSQEIK